MKFFADQVAESLEPGYSKWRLTHTFYTSHTDTIRVDGKLVILL